MPRAQKDMGPRDAEQGVERMGQTAAAALTGAVAWAHVPRLHATHGPSPWAPGGGELAFGLLYLEEEISASTSTVNALACAGASRA